MPDGLPIPEVAGSPRGSLQNECRKEDVVVLYKSICCVFLLSGYAERMQKEGRVSVMNLKSKRYSYSAFVQAAFAQFLGYSKGQKPSGFLRKLQDLHPEFVPQSVRQMVTSMIGLWSAKSEPHSTTHFVAPTDATKLEGGL